MADYGLQANIGADTSDLDSALSNLTSSLGAASEKISGLGDAGSDATDKLKDGVEGAGKAAEDTGGQFDALGKKLEDAFSVLAILELGKKLIEFGQECSEAFGKAEKTSAQLEFAITKIGGGSEETFKELIEWTEQYSSSLNDLYTPTQLQSAEKQLAVMGLNADQIKDLLPLVVDYAQATGKDLSEAAQVAVAAINGQTRGLKEIGGRFEDTGDQTKNLALLMEKLGKVSGVAKNELGLFANQEQETKNHTEEMEEEMGKTTSVFSKIWQTISNGFSVHQYLISLQQDGKISAEQYLTAMRKLGDGAQDNVKDVSDYIAKIKELGEVMRKSKEDSQQYAYGGAKFGETPSLFDFQANQPAANELGKTLKGQQQKGDPADKIKNLDEILKEAQSHMTAFGETPLVALDNEVKEITKSMQALYDKGLQNSQQFKDLSKQLTTGGKRSDVAIQSLQPKDIAGVSDGGDTSYKKSSQELALEAIQEQANRAAAAVSLFGNTNLSELNASLMAVENQMIKLKADGKDVGAAWDDLEAQQAKLKGTIDSTTASINAQANATKGQAAASQLAGQMAAGLANAVANAAASGGKVNLGTEMLKSIGNLAKQKGEAYIAMGGADIATGVGAGLGALEIAGGIALVSLGTKMAATKMAAGGVVSGSAFVNVGEYPGAAHNPEVIAPLDKLKGMMGNGGGNTTHTFNVEGNRLVSVMDKQNTNTMFTIGGGGN